MEKTKKKILTTEASNVRTLHVQQGAKWISFKIDAQNKKKKKKTLLTRNIITCSCPYLKKVQTQKKSETNRNHLKVAAELNGIRQTVVDE